MSIVNTLYVTNHYGSIEFQPTEDIMVKVNLDDNQRTRFIAMCEDIYAEQQAEAAAAIARPLPALADYSIAAE